MWPRDALLLLPVLAGVAGVTNKERFIKPLEIRALRWIRWSSAVHKSVRLMQGNLIPILHKTCDLYCADKTLVSGTKIERTVRIECPGDNWNGTAVFADENFAFELAVYNYLEKGWELKYIQMHEILKWMEDPEPPVPTDPSWSRPTPYCTVKP